MHPYFFMAISEHAAEACCRRRLAAGRCESAAADLCCGVAGSVAHSAVSLSAVSLLP